MANLYKRSQVYQSKVSALESSPPSNLSVFSPLDTLKKRAWAKYRTRGLVSKLAHVTAADTFSERYWRSWHCCSELSKKVIDGKEKIVASSYCKQRNCVCCARIRIAQAINTYKDRMQELFRQPYFVTLTARTVHRSQLEGRVDEMLKVFSSILTLARQPSTQRRLGVRLSGVRSLEVTHNKTTGKYHAHCELL